MNVKSLTEQQREQVTVGQLARLLLRYFKERQQGLEHKFSDRPNPQIPDIELLLGLLLKLCPLPNGIIGVNESYEKIDWVTKNYPCSVVMLSAFSK